MITWQDVQQQQQRDTLRAAMSAIPANVALQGALNATGTPQNAQGENITESLENPAGDPYLRCNRNAISEGVLGA